MKKLLLTSLLAAGFAAQASAAGFYAGGSLGVARMDALEDYAYATAPAFSTITVSSGEGGIKLFGGYHINKYFAVEGGYTNLGEHIFDTSTPNTTRTWDINAIFIDALLTLPLSESLSIFGKLGYAATKTEYTTTSPNYRATKSENVGKIGVGGEFVIAKHYGVRVEYEHYPDLGDPSRTGLESDVNFLSAGFNYKF